MGHQSPGRISMNLGLALACAVVTAAALSFGPAGGEAAPSPTTAGRGARAQRQRQAARWSTARSSTVRRSTARSRNSRKHRRWVAKRKKRRKRKFAEGLPPRYTHRWDSRCPSVGFSRKVCYHTARSGDVEKIHQLAMKMIAAWKTMMDKTSPRDLKRLQERRDKYFHVSRWWWDRFHRDKQFWLIDGVDRLIQPVLDQYDSSSYRELLRAASALLDHKALSRPREVALISRLSRWLKRRPAPVITQALIRRFSKAIFREQKCHWWYVVFIATFSTKAIQRVGAKIDPSWCKYRRYYLRAKFRMPSELAGVLRKLAQTYPKVARLRKVGKSFEGRTIWGLQVGRIRDSSAPTSLLVGSQHGDEHMGGELLTHYVEELFKRYASREKQVRHWFATRQMWFIPVLNPDGYRFDLIGGVIKWWRYNRSVQTNGEIGVDLNRNWDFKWKKYSYYRWGRIELPGSKPFSEPETRAIERLSWQIRKLTGILDVHQSGSVVLTPWAFTRKPAPGIYGRLFKKIGRYLTQANGYRVWPARHLYPHQATLGDWGFGRHKIVSLVLELGRTVYVKPHQKQRIFRENKLLLDRFLHLSLDPFAMIRKVRASRGRAN